MELQGEYDDNNVFARIIRQLDPCFQVYEDEATLAFLDIYPQAEGHTLVIPKTACCRNLLDVPQELLGPLIRSVQRVARAVVTALQSDGFELQQLNGSAAGQTVFHLHFHIIPRENSVPLIAHGEAKRANDSDLEIVAARIRSNFADVGS